MNVKSWVLQRVHGIGAAAGRADLPPRDSMHDREPDLDPKSADARARAGLFVEPSLTTNEALGAYGPLIGAVRTELEHFVAGHVRLHVVIADRDRFVLTAIGVRSPGGAAARERLQQFMREFRPEQVKRYFAREVIGRLPNAAVIDLSQFAGLSDLEAGGHEVENEYAELLAALRTEEPESGAPYEISVLGRWIESDPERRPAADGSARADSTPATPLAGRRCTFDLVDADGPRRVVLPVVVPGRRYSVGKGSDCDIRLNGTYSSRRHAEVWFEGDGWFVCDAGSTNGVRVEPVSPAGGDRAQRDGGPGAAPGGGRVMPLGPGRRVVLSARADGPPGDYPWLGLHDPSSTAPTASPKTPVADPIAHARDADDPAAPSTPSTAVLHVNARACEPVLTIGEPRPGGVRLHHMRPSELPISIGRSRARTIVIDWSHAGVSGHHIDIDRVDDEAAYGTVRGDNGVEIEGEHHGPGTAVRWGFGQTMALGGSLPGEASCRLTLARHAEH